MRVQERLGAPVLKYESVVVADLCASKHQLWLAGSDSATEELTLGVQSQRAVLQRLLESGRHELVPSPTLAEDGKVNPEPEEVHDGGNDDEAECASEKVLGDMLLRAQHV